MLMFYPCETYRRNNYRFCPDCGVSLPQTPCPIEDSEFWKQVDEEAITLGAMLEAYSEVAASSMAACPACGFNNEPDALFCGSCGASMADVKPSPPAGASSAGSAPVSAAGSHVCASCGAENEAGAAFCEMCGANLPAGGAASASAMACGSCGAQNEPGAAFCEMCGASLSAGGALAEEPMGAAVTGDAGLNCPSCGHPNEPGAAFCEMCGANLQDAAASQAALPQGVVDLPDPSAEVSFDLGGDAPMDDFSFDAAPSGGAAEGAGKTCNVCGSGNAADASFCEVCGSGLD